VALSVLLMIGLLARGHLLQSLGIAFACEHPGADPSAQEVDPHDAGTGDSECPQDCHDCPCGQIPMVPPSLPTLVPYVELEPYLIEDATPASEPKQAPPHRLERPPRRTLS
jgi:hypothetical protein